MDARKRLQFVWVAMISFWIGIAVIWLLSLVNSWTPVAMLVFCIIAALVFRGEIHLLQIVAGIAALQVILYLVFDRFIADFLIQYQNAFIALNIAFYFLLIVGRIGLSSLRFWLIGIMSFIVLYVVADSFDLTKRFLTWQEEWMVEVSELQPEGEVAWSKAEEMRKQRVAEMTVQNEARNKTMAVRNNSIWLVRQAKHSHRYNACSKEVMSSEIVFLKEGKTETVEVLEDEAVELSWVSGSTEWEIKSSGWTPYTCISNQNVRGYRSSKVEIFESPGYGYKRSIEFKRLFHNRPSSLRVTKYRYTCFDQAAKKKLGYK